jgi:hypothetical protein
VSEVDHSFETVVRYCSLFLKLEIHSAVSVGKSDLRTIHEEENNGEIELLYEGVRSLSTMGNDNGGPACTDLQITEEL